MGARGCGLKKDEEVSELRTLVEAKTLHGWTFAGRPGAGEQMWSEQEC